ncbi:MAG: hypothetical protein U0794_07100 [Isosphaeraceae bacterium]
MSGPFGILLLALISIIVATPLLIEEEGWDSISSLLLSAVLLAALHAARPGRKPLLVGVCLIGLDFLLGRIAMTTPSIVTVALQSTFWLLSLIYVTAIIAESMFEASEVTVETLQTALCVYLLIGVLFGFGLSLLDQLSPGSFLDGKHAHLDWTDAEARARSFMKVLEYSFASLSGAGGASISPGRGLVLNLTSLESMAGQIYLAVVIARLVGIGSTSASEAKQHRQAASLNGSETRAVGTASADSSLDA